MNNMLLRISLLLNDLDFHDGTSLGAALGLTRAGVWKIIKKLIAYGIEIESVKGKGYRLKEPLYLLDENKILEHVKYSGSLLYLLEKTTSTNDYLKALTDEKNSLIICLAETQTQGKGRLNRKWHSPFGKNIYLSMRYPIQKDVSELSGLSLVVALAVASALETIIELNESIDIKWPNDLVVDQKKLGGNLIELQAESNGQCLLIIGVGININLEVANEQDIDQPWTSLRALTGKIYDRNRLCTALINSLITYIERFTQYGLIDFMSEWHKRDSLYKQSISLYTYQKCVSGIGLGINEQGHLRMQEASGVVQLFASGDASFRKKEQ